jgi:hypothetical protein
MKQHNFGSHGRLEANLFSLALLGFFIPAMLSSVFPFLEDLMTYFIILVLATGALTLLINRLRDAAAMWHVLHVDVETLRQEELDDEP